ncbi:amino acid adenylation domain-containing protein [Streptomyces sp. NPDC004787]|uniref:amino acid adenylation domain-containing protein n=1 Tax=Streptomyces sp. NPDC004787 TaxID=3154291 RepID=UPI0033AB75FC
MRIRQRPDVLYGDSRKGMPMHRDSSREPSGFPDGISREDAGESWQFPEVAGIHSLVDRWVRKTPDAVAVIDNSRVLTYAGLAEQSSRLARYLSARGVRRGDRVGVSLPRGSDAVIALLAVLKTGGAYVPLDPMLPHRRLEYMLGDAGLTVLLTRDFMDEHREEIARKAADPLDIPVSGDDIAYVIYTSGSTGRPKGVEITHTGIADLVTCAAYTSFGPGTRFLHVFSLSSDVSGMEIWTPLVHGGCLVIPSSGVLSCSELQQAIAAYRVTDAVLPAAWFHRQVEEAPASFSGMRTLMVGVEVLSPDHAEACLRANPGLRLVNGYGPTETTVYSTCYVMDSPDQASRPVPIGSPTPNTVARILDADQRTVPAGVAGELYLGGPGIARGYLSNPGLTAERFIADPYDPPGRLYRTGDLVRLSQKTGLIEYIGRIDRQIKLNGFRIEPGEIEAELGSIPGISQAYVIRHSAPGREPALAAYYTTAGATLQETELRTLLSERLPGYMVPNHLVRLESLPMTVTGKVDPQALPEPGRQKSPAGTPAAAPQNPVEEEIHSLWQDILGTDHISVNDSFVSLGGSSLAAMRAAAEISRRFRVQVPLSAFLDSGTVASLSVLVSRLSDEESSIGDIPAVEREERCTPLPATAGQRGLWYHDQMFPGSATYSEAIPLRLHGPLNTAVLRQCLDRLAARHETLRTALVFDGTELVQHIQPPGGVTLAEVDVPGAGWTEADLAAAVRQLAARPFSLAEGPHLRAHLIRISEQDHLLLLSAHHVSIDGWSLNILFRELAVLYKTLLAGREPQLETQRIQFADFAVWQDEQLRAGKFKEDAAYWRRQLAGADPVLRLPADVCHSTGDRAGKLTFATFPGSTVDQIDRFARSAGVTRYMVLLAAFQVMLAQHTGTRDVIVGAPASGRIYPGLENAVGYFINILPLRTHVRSGEEFRELLERVRSSVLEAYAHQRLPFSEILRAGGVPLDSPTPLVQAALVPEDVYEHSFSLSDDLHATFQYYDAGSSKFDLTLALIPDTGGDGLRVSAEYRAGLFRQTTVVRWLNQLEHMLVHIARAPDITVQALGDLPADSAQCDGCRKQPHPRVP